jgi:hypothetical protein
MRKQRRALKTQALLLLLLAAAAQRDAWGLHEKLDYKTKSRY